MNAHKSKYSSLLLLIGVLFIIWNILGIMDAKNYTYLGYNSDDNYAVNIIEEGSPAESAGLQMGDIIKSTGGILITDSKANSERQRAKIGETREYIVDRNGEDVTLQLTFAPLIDKDKNLNRVGNIIGLIFILLGLFANFKFKSELSFAFAMFAVCFGFIFFIF